LPDWLPMICAPAIPACYATTYCCLVEKARLKKGEVLLVLAAAGGVGLAACQLGKALGATVIAVASSKEKLDICRMEGGADYLVNYTEDKDWEKTVNGITKKMGKAWEGADGLFRAWRGFVGTFLMSLVVFAVIIDPVGEPNRILKCIARNGRLVDHAGSFGRLPSIDADSSIIDLLALPRSFHCLLAPLGISQPDSSRLRRPRRFTLHRAGQVDGIATVTEHPDE